MSVTATNIYSEARNVLVNLIQTSLIDPKTHKTNSNRRWLYREVPDTTKYDFGGYPSIVVESPDLDDGAPQDLWLSTNDTELTFTVEIATEYNDQDARLDELCSQFHGMFKSFYNLNVFEANNMYEPSITSSPSQPVTRDGKKINVRVFTVVFHSTIQMS